MWVMYRGVEVTPAEAIRLKNLEAENAEKANDVARKLQAGYDLEQIEQEEGIEIKKEEPKKSPCD